MSKKFCSLVAVVGVLLPEFGGEKMTAPWLLNQSFHVTPPPVLMVVVGDLRVVTVATVLTFCSSAILCSVEAPTRQKDPGLLARKHVARTHVSCRRARVHTDCLVHRQTVLMSYADSGVYAECRYQQNMSLKRCTLETDIMALSSFLSIDTFIDLSNHISWNLVHCMR